jgi:hypothetical protein
MSDELFKDIGISQAEAIHEAQRHFWDTAPRDKAYGQELLLPELNLYKTPLCFKSRQNISICDRSSP